MSEECAAYVKCVTLNRVESSRHPRTARTIERLRPTERLFSSVTSNSQDRRDIERPRETNVSSTALFLPRRNVGVDGGITSNGPGQLVSAPGISTNISARAINEHGLGSRFPACIYGVSSR